MNRSCNSTLFGVMVYSVRLWMAPVSTWRQGYKGRYTKAGIQRQVYEGSYTKAGIQRLVHKGRYTKVCNGSMLS